MAYFCSQCGQKLDEGALFCSSCGAKVAGNSAVQNPVIPNPAVPNPAVPNYQPQVQNTFIQKTNRKGPLIPVLFVICAVVAAVSIYFVTRSTPEKTLNKFEKSYNSLDANGMIECFEPNAQAMYKGTNALLAGITGYDVNTIFEGVLGYADFAFDDTQPKVDFDIVNVDYTTNSRAQVEVSYSYYNGSSYENSTDYIPMVKDGGKWYIAFK